MVDSLFLKDEVSTEMGQLQFVQDDYGVEVTIFEQGVEPEFRVYT